MENIQMVDLHGQYIKIKTQVDAAIQEVIDQTAFINGPQVKIFSEALEKYLGVKHVIPCANGTDALQIAMMALDLKPGDEVITTSYTYVATCEVIALLQLTPVFIEVNPNTFTMDPNAIEKVITSKTKAIVPVHLYGQCADMEEILAVAKKHNLYVIEDTAQAIGAQYTFSDGKKAAAGCMGDIGTTSFFPSKNLGCYGDGGAIFTNDDNLAEKLRMVANHGQKVRYYHDIVGVNSRLDTIQAAILNCKLPHVDAYSAARRAVADRYDAAFDNHPNLKAPVRNSKSTHVFHQYTLTCCNVNREELQEYLKSKGIPTMIYYPLPVHLQKGYSMSKFEPGSLAMTEVLCKNVISLPIHTEMRPEVQDYIIEQVLAFFNS
jgi:UDP-2-acetamido-2-deoxy-ribo-hexuluronate aminotransferase